MPREHCHKTDTFLPEPTAASHPCSAEKRKNKCPATSVGTTAGEQVADLRTLPAWTSLPLSAAGEARPPVDTGHAVRMRDLHGAARADGGSAPDRSVPARRPLSIRTYPSLQPLPGRAAPADDPHPGPAEHDPRPEETADRSPGKTSGHPRRKKRKKRAPTEKAPGGLRKKPRTIRAEAQPAALPRRRTCPATETEGCGGNDFPRCLS